MNAQISFQCCALESPLPRQETGRDCERNADCRGKKIEISDRFESRLFAQKREEFENSAHDKQRDRKVNYHRMLRVAREQPCSYIERISGREKERVHCSTTIFPVILG